MEPAGALRENYLKGKEKIPIGQTSVTSLWMTFALKSRTSNWGTKTWQKKILVKRTKARNSGKKRTFVSTKGKGFDSTEGAPIRVEAKEISKK